MRIPPDRPFVLLDDARAQGAGAARLYRDPVATVIATDAAEVPAALARLDQARRDGLHAAGYLGYGAAAAFEPRLAGGERGALPVLWFGLFDRVALIAPADIPALLGDPAGIWAGAPRPEIDARAYAAMFARVRDYIAAGDIYQANLSFRARVPVQGDPLALYARLRAASLSGWGGALFTGEHWLLSASPELFFTLSDGALVARPMKGTAPRGEDGAADRAAATALGESAKDRAENLMIVDLLRNDLSRVAEPGSVAVPALFAVETYPTIHTMTSTVTATLAPGQSAVDVLAALFPCGSVTGAPKIRAMEIIAEVEPSPRGAYTGSIGWLDPAGDAAFNVVIRTLTMERGAIEQGRIEAEIGLGSAVVADSTAAGEWAECLAKGRFVTAGARPFDLIETMAFDPGDGLLLLDRHLARMKASAVALGFAFDRHGVRNELQAATFKLREPARVRLLLGRSGAVSIEIRPAPARQDNAVIVAVAPLPVAPLDFRLRHKTTDRDFYRDALAAAGCFEVVFADGEGRLTEGSFTNIFVERDGRLLTPPLTRGLLPGVLRAELIDQGRAVEADLTVADLADGFLIGNAVRGLMAAALK